MSHRSRNFASIVYPESAPKNFKSIMEDYHVPTLISPLHDEDRNGDGTLKKPHYHILVLFDGVKTLEQVKEIFDAIGGVGIEIVKNVRSYARYLCHLDSDDKVKYDIDDVISLSGADYQNMINLAKDKYTAIGEMIEYCIDNHITSYATLLLYAKETRQDWFKVLCDNGSLTILSFLKARVWEIEKYERRER